VRRHLLDVTVLFALATCGVLYVALTQPSWRSIALHGYLLAIGGLLMLAVVLTVGDAAPPRRQSELDRALDHTKADAKPLPELEKLQREVTLATAAANDLHYRLLPQLREIAQARLERSGHSPGPDTLGRWWELLRPDRPAPEDGFAPGIPRDELRALVADLERM